MIDDQDDEVQLFFSLCLKEDRDDILNATLTYTNFCKLIFLIGTFKLFTPMVYLAEHFPKYWKRYNDESDARAQVAYHYEYLNYPFHQYYTDEIYPKEQQWFQEYYNQLNIKQRKKVKELIKQY